MNIIIVLLFLGLLGCAATPSGGKVSSPCIKKAAAGKQGITVGPKELDGMISVFSEAIKQAPNDSGAYYNRAVAYYYKKDYDKSWQDVHKVQEISKVYDTRLAQLINKLKKASKRNK